ncbi:cell division control protein [Plectosphaerella cucumerina]|uniref:Cell division control protein n=1 Tax=Plectosphaerella cucumerina TaxID=40658 RepID=A0A8K0TSH5_9PEZI|nr:cell division control protein [Plectosphaerella cucumerina]
MYLPRSLISKLYIHLQHTRHPLSPPVLILVALEPDALCACRILTRLLKHDYIPHKIQPIAGYADLERAGQDLVSPMMESNGGNGGVVVCLGVGGMVDLGTMLGLEPEGDGTPFSGVEVWVMDSHRPWNLGNVFGGYPPEPETDMAPDLSMRYQHGVKGGRIDRAYKPGKGGIIVFDDGDIEDNLAPQGVAYLALLDMPDVEDDGHDIGDSDGEQDEDLFSEEHARAGQKRKSWSDREEDDESSGDDDRPAQRRRSNSSGSIPSPPRRLPQRPGLLSLQDQDMVVSSDSLEPPSAAQCPPAPSAGALRRRLLRMRRENEDVLRKYYKIGGSFSEPIASMMYSLASELGREDNDLLWLTIVGVTSMELYGRSSAGIAVPVRSSDRGHGTGWMGVRGARIRQLLRDEVRRLNPPDISNPRNAVENTGIIPTSARSPEDTSIRLSPEPRFLLIRHWSLYDSMLHSPYLFSRLRTWSEPGLKRLHKLLAKMGVSLVQCKQNYTHMDMMLKRELRTKLLKYASLYNLDDMVPSIDTDGKDRAGAKDGWGFVRSWGWRATLSAQDVGVVLGALLEVGKQGDNPVQTMDMELDPEAENEEMEAQGNEWVARFWEAYDALENIDALKAGLPTAQFLHRAIYRTGTSLINKKQIKHLRAFRLCVVKDGPDVTLFTHPAALTKLALWVGEALVEQEKDATGRLSHGGRGTPLVVASLNEKRGVYVVVGTGGGGGPDTAFLDREAAKKRQAAREEKAKKKEESRRNKALLQEQKRAAKRQAAGENGNDDDDDELETESEASDDDSESDDDDEDEEQRREHGYGLNKFGSAFQEVVGETNARVRIDSFEHCVVEVRKEDLGGFLESLSMKAVVG